MVHTTEAKTINLLTCTNVTVIGEIQKPSLSDLVVRNAGRHTLTIELHDNTLLGSMRLIARERVTIQPVGQHTFSRAGSCILVAVQAGGARRRYVKRIADGLGEVSFI